MLQVSQKGLEFVQTYPPDHLFNRYSLLTVDNTSGCIQGCALLAAGFEPTEIRQMEPWKTDRAFANFMGITLTVARLARHLNDSGVPPLKLFLDPEKVLGPHWRQIIALWTIFENTRPDQIFSKHEVWANSVFFQLNLEFFKGNAHFIPGNTRHAIKAATEIWRDQECRWTIPQSKTLFGATMEIALQEHPAANQTKFYFLRLLGFANPGTLASPTAD